MMVQELPKPPKLVSIMLYYVAGDDCRLLGAPPVARAKPPTAKSSHPSCRVLALPLPIPLLLAP
jgi:hypothetical protein